MRAFLHPNDSASIAGLAITLLGPRRFGDILELRLKLSVLVRFDSYSERGYSTTSRCFWADRMQAILSRVKRVMQVEI